MKIQIPKCDVDVTDVLRVHVESRLGLALVRFADQSDGLRPRLDVEVTDVDLFAAVNHATDRASRSVARAVEQGRP